MSDQFRNFEAPSRPQRVAISWSMETPADDCSDAPDERDASFWPSRNPSDPGYIGTRDLRAWGKMQEAALKRMDAWKRDEWNYVGVVAVAHVAIPIGGGSFVRHTFRSAGVRGIESDAVDYLRETFESEKAELLSHLTTLSAALQSGDFDQEDAE